MRLFFRYLCSRLGFAAAALLAAATIAQPAHGQTATPAPGSAATRIILVLGDSLSAEYGVERGSGWVPLLQKRLDEQKPGYKVVNASISGDTTSGGVTRLPALLAQHHPAVVIIELGSNDALRGLQLNMTENNLRTLAQESKRAGAQVVLVGMQIPPNYGRDYTTRFAALFPRIAQENQASLVPFLLDGIATNRELFQADGMHPNEAGQPKLLDNVWPVLAPLLK
ncbi:arylesterase [Achromobacter aloeverae]|uniref:Arylesterase n=1 Tax=Achromobacter aloeverae TaxID=1750518 RepID=A0A4Q1HPA8_9BURK|nr:arylesterase [Achromobacter aloeverae]RXN91374.1 arylesterase [Achromobacter aloeverae]